MVMVEILPGHKYHFCYLVAACCVCMVADCGCCMVTVVDIGMFTELWCRANGDRERL
jgi:hypothetical protein